MSNSHKALEQIVSVDGWIGRFDDNGIASVHADVVFREGYFGKDSSSTVRFKVLIKRAEIVVCIPNDGPIEILRRTIHRNPIGGARERRIKTETNVEGQAAVDVSVSMAYLPSASAAANANAKASRNTVEEYLEHITDFIEQHFTTPDKQPGWEVEKKNGTSLTGSPWNAADVPRFQVKRTVSEEQPYARIEIRCRREDLEIQDLELKDPMKQRFFLRRPEPDKNRAAAEQIIKEELSRVGFLGLPDMAENYGIIRIADVVITEDVN